MVLAGEAGVASASRDQCVSTLSVLRYLLFYHKQFLEYE